MKKLKRKTIVRPSKSAIHAMEFHRGVKDLSSTELNYRLSENNKVLDAIGMTIGELLEDLKNARAEFSKVGREHDVLTGILESRR